MTRIISGTAGGRRLATPPGVSTRPTSERVREALFSRLEHRDLIADAVVLDLFAGSGALGLECASRGAARVLLVESNPKAAKVIRENSRAVGHPVVELRTDTVERTLAQGPGADAAWRAHLVLIDPPYDLSEDELAGVLGLLVTGGWLAPEAFVVVERSKRSPMPTWPAGLVLSGEKQYGETTMWFAEPDDGEAVA